MDGVEHRKVKANGINIHVAEKGEGEGNGEASNPIILFIHGFPQSSFSWRHQIQALASLGYRTLAPDLRGYGDSDAPSDVGSYTCFHVVGDLVGVLDAMGADQVFVVGHDWGAIIAWYFCLFRPDRVKALVNMSVAYYPRHPIYKPLHLYRRLYGDDFYICRFQEAGEMEREIAEAGTAVALKLIFGNRDPSPPCLPKGKSFQDVSADGTPIALPPWLPEEEFHHYVTKFEERGFTGGLNYYRNMDRNWELTAAWTGSEVKVPTKFIVGDMDLTYHFEDAKEYINGGEFKKNVPLLEEVVVLEGVGHFLQEEKPDEINKHIHEFFHNFLFA